MFGPYLPPELIAEVIIHVKSRHDLLQLMLLSENWRCEIERLLYTKVTITTKQKRRYQALTAEHLLKLCPRIGRIITSLNAWIVSMNCKSMKLILESVPNLRSLTMNFGFNYRSAPFHQYIPSSQPPFSLRIFSTDHQGSSDIDTFLRTQPCLEDIYLGTPTFKSWETLNSLGFANLLSLRTYSSRLAAVLLEAHTIERLHFLGDGHEMLELVAEINGKTFPTVKALALNLSRDVGALVTAFPNVRSLQIFAVGRPMLHRYNVSSSFAPPECTHSSTTTLRLEHSQTLKTYISYIWVRYLTKGAPMTLKLHFHTERGTTSATAQG